MYSNTSRFSHSSNCFILHITSLTGAQHSTASGIMLYWKKAGISNHFQNIRPRHMLTNAHKLTRRVTIHPDRDNISHLTQSCNVNVIDWAGFNVSTNTVHVIRETVLQVKRPNQQHQSTEGKVGQPQTGRGSKPTRGFPPCYKWTSEKRKPYHNTSPEILHYAQVIWRLSQVLWFPPYPQTSHFKHKTTGSTSKQELNSNMHNTYFQIEILCCTESVVHLIWT